MSERESLKDKISRLFMLDLVKGLFVTLKYHNASLMQRRGKTGAPAVDRRSAFREPQQ